jgi:transposase
MRRKITELEQALDCAFFTSLHAFILAMMLASIDHLTAQIQELTARIQVLCQPCEHQIAQPGTIPGSGISTAQEVIAETGTDMSVFPAPAHLASWARRAPRSASRPAGARAAAAPAAATPAWVPRPARPAPPPDAPRPSPAPDTGGWSSRCPSSKPRARSADPSSS